MQLADFVPDSSAGANSSLLETMRTAGIELRSSQGRVHDWDSGKLDE